MDIGFTFGRMLTGMLVTAALSIGGVWWVVEQSQSGMQTAIETTNKRIDDVLGGIGEIKTDIRGIASVSAAIDKRLAVVEAKIDAGFQDTRTEIRRKAQANPTDAGIVPIRVALYNLSRRIEERAQLEAMLSNKPQLVFLPTETAWDEFASVVNPEFMASLESQDQRKVFQVLRRFTVEGINGKEFIETVKKKPEGTVFTSMGGASVTGKLVGDQVVITTGDGSSAVVEGVGFVNSDRVSTFRINSVLDISGIK